MATDTPEVLRCSFCNKRQSDVQKLIAGPTVYICEECVNVCNDILADGGIAAGRGARAGLRAVRIAEEYLGMATDLSGAGNQLGAAREVRNAALAVLRGLATVDGESAAKWPETKVVLTALEDGEVARLLHVEDAGHVLLRVSLDGAELSAAEVDDARAVTRQLVELLRRKADPSPDPS